MTLVEKCFFFGFLTLQFLLPLRRHLYALLYRKGAVMRTSRFFTFAWTMRLRQIGGGGYLEVFDRESGRPLLQVYPEELLMKNQVRHLYANPRSLLPWVKFLEKRLKESGMKDFGIRSHLWGESTHWPRQLLVDPKCDLTQEPEQWLRSYWWDLLD